MRERPVYRPGPVIAVFAVLAWGVVAIIVYAVIG